MVKGRAIGLDKIELDEEETAAFLEHVARCDAKKITNVVYKCGCTADGDLVAVYCPIHDEPQGT